MPKKFPWIRSNHHLASVIAHSKIAQPAFVCTLYYVFALRVRFFYVQLVATKKVGVAGMASLPLILPKDLAAPYAPPNN